MICWVVNFFGSRGPSMQGSIWSTTSKTLIHWWHRKHTYQISSLSSLTYDISQMKYPKLLRQLRGGLSSLYCQKFKSTLSFLFLNHFPCASLRSHFKFSACLVFSNRIMSKTTLPTLDTAENNTKSYPNLVTKPVQFPAKLPPSFPKNKTHTNPAAINSYIMMSNSGLALCVPDTRVNSTCNSTCGSTASKLAHFDKVKT